MSPHPDDAPARGREPRIPAQLRVLVGLIALEALALVAATVYLVVELLVDTPDSFVSAVALTVVVAIGAVGVAAIAVGALRGQPWIRGAGITVQVLQIALAIGSFQGLFARPGIGWLLLTPAIAVIVLMFSRPVVLATTRPEEQA